MHPCGAPGPGSGSGARCYGCIPVFLHGWSGELGVPWSMAPLPLLPSSAGHRGGALLLVSFVLSALCFHLSVPRLPPSSASDCAQPVCLRSWSLPFFLSQCWSPCGLLPPWSLPPSPCTCLSSSLPSAPLSLPLADLPLPLWAVAGNLSLAPRTSVCSGLVSMSLCPQEPVRGWGWGCL